MKKALLWILLMTCNSAQASGVIIIPENTAVPAGCTADGACWPAFTTQRRVRVKVVPKSVLPDKRGLCICTIPLPLILVRPDEFYSYSELVNHELGHDNGVTRHSDGSTWQGELK